MKEEKKSEKSVVENEENFQQAEPTEIENADLFQVAGGLACVSNTTCGPNTTG
jgi:hypothetical protein